MVEDDAVIAEQIRKYLEKWGYEVEAVKDFADVIGQFAVYEPSLCCWISVCPFITVITGAARSGRYPRCRSSLSRLRQTI